MNSCVAPAVRFSRGLNRWLAPLLLGGALLMAGCVTTEQVTSIVAQSNAAMLSSQLGGLSQKNADRPGSSWQQAYEQIEAFIAVHPDQKPITAPLRIREAMLLLANEQPSLARAAFDSVEANDLHTDRDRALKANSESLIWWFSRSTNATWSQADQTKATQALAELAKAQTDLGKSPDIRDYLAEMRAWIGLASAKQTTDESQARRRLIDALDGYVGIFSPEDLSLIERGAEPQPELKALTSDVRRRLRAALVLTAAQKQNKDDRLQAHPANPTFDRLINR